MKVLKKNNGFTKSKGFTLVELIVVIAIIGILAAVLIPALTGYIERARKSNDEQLAGSMTTAIQAYCIDNDIDQSTLLGTDVRTILLFEGYNLVPRTSKWVFVYDIVEKSVKVVDLENGVMAAAVEVNPSDPTNIEVGRYLISKGSSPIEVAVNTLCNLTDVSHYYDALSMTSASIYKSVIQSFDPKNTLYIKNSSVYTTAGITDSITRIVCNELTVNIPNKAITSPVTLANNLLPAVIKTVENASGIGTYFGNVKVVTSNDIGVIELDDFIAHSSEGYVYKVKLGAYVVNSSAQEFTDEIINIRVSYNQIINEETDVVTTYKCFTVTRKFMVSYYNQSGLYARGSMVYSTYSEYELNADGNII